MYKLWANTLESVFGSVECDCTSCGGELSRW